MLLKNLFAGQQWRNRHREQTNGHRERGEEGDQAREAGLIPGLGRSPREGNGNPLQ